MDQSEPDWCEGGQELCKSGGGRPGLPIPNTNSLYSFCGGKATLYMNWLMSFYPMCVPVYTIVFHHVSLLGRQDNILAVLDFIVSKVKQHWDMLWADCPYLFGHDVFPETTLKNIGVIKLCYMIHMVVCVCVCVWACVCVCVALWLVWHQPALGVCCLHFPCFLQCLNFYLFSPAFTNHLVVRSEQFTHERPIDWLAVGSDHVIVMLLFTHSDTRCAGFCLPLAKHAVMRQERLTASGPQYWQPVCSDIVYYIYS